MEFKTLKHVFLVSRLKSNDAIGPGYIYSPIVYGLEREINLLSDKDQLAVIESSSSTGGDHTSYDTARFLGIRKRDIVSSDSFSSTLQSFKSLAKKEESTAIVIIPRDKELLNIYLEKIKDFLSLNIEIPKIAYPEYWKAWNLDLNKKSLRTIGYSPSDITNETEYVNGDGHAACFHRDFVIDPQTKRKVCIHERYCADPYGMDEKQY